MTALISGGWEPETSRSFHYWLPALPCMVNPGNPVMNHSKWQTDLTYRYDFFGFEKFWKWLKCHLVQVHERKEKWGWYHTCLVSSALPCTGTDGFPLISPRVIASYSCKLEVNLQIIFFSKICTWLDFFYFLDVHIFSINKLMR